MNSNPTSKSPETKPAWFERTELSKSMDVKIGNDFVSTLLRDRWEMCHTIARSAWHKGLKVDPFIVNRHYKWFKLWYAGGLATGHLMGRTGVRFRQRNTTRKEGE